MKQSAKDVAVLCGAGITLHEALKAYELLKKDGIHVAVVDIYCIKPFNHVKFAAFVKKHGGKFIVSEDHYKEGGIYEMIAAGLSDAGLSEGIESMSLHVSEMPRSGTPDELLSYEGIDAASMVKAVKNIV